jgi:hypothetical protein
VRRTDIRRSAGQLRFSPRPKRFKTVRKFSWTGSGAYIENAAGRVESREQAVEFGIEYQSADTLTFSYAVSMSSCPRPFRIASSVTVPVGGYDTDTVAVNYTFGPQRKVVVGLNRGIRDVLQRAPDGDLRDARTHEPRSALLARTHLLGNRVNLRGGQFTTHLAGSRVTYTMTPQMFRQLTRPVQLLQQRGDGERTPEVGVSAGSELFVVIQRRTRHARRADFRTWPRALSS